ncbi:OmpA family protein [Pelagibius sp. Alg239-R121]|uniref:OmpA family protein n=1 Tax=Pelagibius sp. Alg239-R121 TaxID=2993448 RepID=UPI0024A7961E|nr:OmpA family protein [Pelagibius sp. Alg239-R121]
MFRYIGGVSCALALIGTILAAPSSVSAEDPVVNADTIAYQLAPKRGLKITAAEPTSINLPDVTFEFNSAQLTPTAKKQLAEVGKALSMSAFKDSKFVIAGHTDAVGTAEYNQQLSKLRAEAAVSFLVREHGMDASRLSATGRGESKLLPQISEDSGANRRVEILNLGTE